MYEEPKSSRTVARWAAKPPGWSADRAIRSPGSSMSIAAWPGVGRPLVRGLQQPRDRLPDEVYCIAVARVPHPSDDKRLSRDAAVVHAPALLVIPAALRLLFEASGDTVAAWQSRLVDIGLMVGPGKKSGGTLTAQGFQPFYFRTCTLPGTDGVSHWFVLKAEVALLTLPELAKLPPAIGAIAALARPVFGPYFERRSPRPVVIPDDWPDHHHRAAPYGQQALVPPMPRPMDDSRAGQIRQTASFGMGVQQALV